MATSPELENEKYTVDDYRNLDDDRRYELIEGELLLTPAPASIHQHFITLFGAEIALHVKRNDLGRTYQTPFDVVLANDTVVQPDLTFVSAERVDEVIDARGATGAPDLVVEVLSPSTERRDRLQKRRIYAEKGVQWLLFAYPRPRIIEVLRLQPDTSKYLIEDTFGPDDTFHIALFEDLQIKLADCWPPEEDA